MKVELLYSEGCPNFEETENMLRTTVSDLGIDPEIDVVKIANTRDAEFHRFPGSPSIRVNGRDIEPGADQNAQYSLGCRVYRTDSGQSGVPPRGLLKDALSRAARE